MVTLLSAFCRKCCRTAETADMANAVLICSSWPPVATPEVFVEIDRSSGLGGCWARRGLSDGRDFDAPDMDVNLVGFALCRLETAWVRRRIHRLQPGRRRLTHGDQPLVGHGRQRRIGCWSQGFQSRVFCECLRLSRGSLVVWIVEGRQKWLIGG